MKARDLKLAGEYWCAVFNFADTANGFYENGFSVELISEIMRSNLKQTEQRIKLAQAFPPDKRIQNVPITVYQAAIDAPDPQKMVEEAWQKNWTTSDIQYQISKWKGEKNQLKEPNRTPIEMALGVDTDGMTTAKKLYAFLELRPGDYSRWVKKNIERNVFAEAENDYFSLRTNAECRDFGVRGNFARDYKLTARLAKKLAMASQSVKGEEARNYFICIEEAVFAKAKDIPVALNGMSLVEQAEVIMECLEQGEHLAKSYRENMVKNAIELAWVL